MGHWLIAHLGGRHDGPQLLSPVDSPRFTAPRGPTGFRDTKVYGSYAMGWFAGEKAETPALHHGGSTPEDMMEMAILLKGGSGSSCSPMPSRGTNSGTASCRSFWRRAAANR